MTEKLRFCETRPVFLLTLPRLSLSVKSVGVAFCVPNGFFMSQMGLSTILKREGCNRGDTLPFSDTLVAPLPTVAHGVTLFADASTGITPHFQQLFKL